MEISSWLEEIGLSRYTETLSEFPLEDLVEFTDDDFKELGVLTPHRKKLLAAIATLNNDASLNDVSTTSDANTSSSSFSIFIKDLPQVIAIPLHEYVEGYEKTLGKEHADTGLAQINLIAAENEIN